MSKQQPQAIHPSDANVVMIASKMPRAQESLLGCIYLYSGTTDSDFTHGYIYECVQGSIREEMPVAFIPGYMACFPEDFVTFLAEATNDYKTITHGTMTYLEAGDIWEFNFYDKDNNLVKGEYKLYTQDIKDAGFVPLMPSYSDEQVIEFECRYMEQLGFEWERLEP